jgi:hypothetical protein
MHRAGMPGFVEVLQDGCSLRWPDYVGNNMFQTLVRPAVVLLLLTKGLGISLPRVHYYCKCKCKATACGSDGAAILLQGNLALNPRAGLLFIDFATGNTLQLTVRHLRTAQAVKPQCWGSQKQYNFSDCQLRCSIVALIANGMHLYNTTR